MKSEKRAWPLPVKPHTTLTATAAADWDCWGKHISVEKCGALYMNEMNTRKRGIVLMHDIHSNTIDMVKQLVPQLKAQGWKFTTVPEVPSIKRALAGVSVAARTRSGSTRAALPTRSARARSTRCRRPERVASSQACVTPGSRCARRRRSQ